MILYLLHPVLILIGAGQLIGPSNASPLQHRQLDYELSNNEKPTETPRHIWWPWWHNLRKSYKGMLILAFILAIILFYEIIVFFIFRTEKSDLREGIAEQKRRRIDGRFVQDGKHMVMLRENTNGKELGGPFSEEDCSKKEVTYWRILCKYHHWHFFCGICTNWNCFDRPCCVTKRREW
ncbi:hypothetical protein BJ508DRAFT_45740 [Ascobolus immersus RN42]|uniref:Uncharacterized protein n=1 Tax=Ascobolus immersus RN42 TaxID=1160509 RepID=A0A3N4ICS8_ASCIM|nr:hypothetical protein BJ508DRAFT_45740 [Ascobolus immersus RN42]